MASIQLISRKTVRLTVDRAPYAVAYHIASTVIKLALTKSGTGSGEWIRLL